MDPVLLLLIVYLTMKVAVLFALIAAAIALDNGLALTPPMVGFGYGRLML